MMSDSQLNIETDDFEEDSSKYNFDYYALSKLKKQKRCTVGILSAIIFVLFVLLIVFITLYAQSQKDKPKTLYAQTQESASYELFKLRAYKELAKYGENCSIRYQCHTHAYCKNLQGTYRCVCMRGYLGDGIGDCQNIDFSIDFHAAGATNIPTIRDLRHGYVHGAAVCFWFTLTSAAKEWDSENKTILNYITDKMDLVIQITRNHKIVAFTRNGNLNVRVEINVKFPVHKWMHVCWTWSNGISWNFFINGNLANSSLLNQAVSLKPGKGDLFLGQDMRRVNDKYVINKPENLFQGRITGLFVYQRLILGYEVMAAFENNPPMHGLLVGWWQFKRLAKGGKIKEAAFPFDINLYSASLP
ncbi:sushi, von Willebrand factor type A, EGF and pentraxin domain-containing protein 1-like [Hydractinia symbiolongicarpus]|uniref:sushi, von Willebrand factor type A, EGF and pentraxin domain-containing protein 1-like n=1 Tax=Hydractinia symbiolongicarpus TaxID=13093 RepID=UPI00254A0291|nr:sushi, von Willebrand factor type A, EGF and pentraxin domain-containing protein 1-like [Hydractinia symbiolongicarpus]